MCTWTQEVKWNWELKNSLLLRALICSYFIVFIEVYIKIIDLYHFCIEDQIYWIYNTVYQWLHKTWVFSSLLNDVVLSSFCLFFSTLPSNISFNNGLCSLFYQGILFGSHSAMLSSVPNYVRLYFSSLVMKFFLIIDLIIFVKPI